LKNLAGFLLHGAAVLGRSQAEALLEIVIQVSDCDAGHWSIPTIAMQSL
jgi:hypothetical protein